MPSIRKSPRESATLGAATDERRLRAVFRRILLLGGAAASVGAAGIAACSSPSTSAQATNPVEDASGTSDDATGYDAAPVPVFEASLVDVSIEWCEAGPPVVFDGGSCDTFRLVPCGLPDGTVPLQCGYLTPPLCKAICGEFGGTYGCHVLSYPCDDAGNVLDAGADDASDAGPTIVECLSCKGGRRPAGYRALRVARSRSAVGEFFARTSHLEAASIHAFDVLHDELRMLGAPTALCSAARRSAREETRHARVTAEIARAHGGRVARPRVAPARARTLEAIAIENVVEGCVGETYGALLAAYQAQHAQDAVIARAMKRIAADETRHAALAWSVAAWAAERLDARAKRRVQRAQKRAIARLRREAAAHVPLELTRVAGLPPRALAMAFVDALEREVWA